MKGIARTTVGLVLLPLLAVLFFFVHAWIQQSVTDIATLPSQRAIKNAGLILSAIVGPALSAALFAYPLARLYGRVAIAAAILICGPAIVYFGTGYLTNSGRPIVIATYVTELICLALFVPAAALLALRRTRGAVATSAPA